jgi:hypothetical protein
MFLFLLLVREEKAEEGEGCIRGGGERVMEASEKRKGDRKGEFDEEKGAMNLYFLF